MDISLLVQKYKEEDKNGLWSRIGDIIDAKAGKWDKGVEGQSPELTQMLIYEYATSLEAITKGKLSAEFVVEKLAKTMGTFRIGDFKEGQDDNIKYDNFSVTSEDYKKKCRIKGKFGAHQIDYNENGRHLYSVAIFDGSQEYQTSDGQIHTLYGGNLDNLDDIRQTLFHEWTHVMEKCLVKASELTRNDILQTRGNSTYINTCISTDLTMEQYKEYIENVDRMLETEEEILFGGISTIEINEKKSPNRRIMHNQISEGATELISKKIMEHLGRPFEKDRYEMQADFVENVFNSLGMDEGISTYLTSSNKIISYIESKNFGDKDVLRDSDTFITSLGNFESALRGWSRGSGDDFSKEFSKIKREIEIFGKHGRAPTQEELETFFQSINKITNIPHTQERYTRYMINFALTFPQRKTEFYENIKTLFPSAKELHKEDFIEVIKDNPEVTAKSLTENVEELRNIDSESTRSDNRKKEGPEFDD